MKKLLMTLVIVSIWGCASSPEQYHVEPTPLKKGESKYTIDNIAVNLTLGHGAIEGDDSFASQEQLQQQFYNYIKQSMKDKDIFVTDKHNSDADVTVNIQYLRNFNRGGKSLNKPEISHQIVVSKNGEKLASTSHESYTTKYSYLKDIAVNAEISMFSWDAEDEPKDVKLVSELIVEDIFNLGK